MLNFSETPGRISSKLGRCVTLGPRSDPVVSKVKVTDGVNFEIFDISLRLGLISTKVGRCVRFGLRSDPVGS